MTRRPQDDHGRFLPIDAYINSNAPVQCVELAGA